jgi:hypothetical protein
VGQLFPGQVSESLHRDGYVMLPGLFSAAEMERIRSECAEALARAGNSLLTTGGSAYGARNLLAYWPGAHGLAQAVYRTTDLREILGPDAGVVRGLYFDKPPGHSWALPWHRDLNIAVKEHQPSNVFLKPTTKAGVPHVEAATELLSRMLTLRIHLDAMTANNGPLRVIPGSHRLDSPAREEQVVLNCDAGDVLLMRPLLLHASGHSAENAGHRRIVHLECAPSPELPDRYEWHTFRLFTTEQERA